MRNVPARVVACAVAGFCAGIGIWDLLVGNIPLAAFDFVLVGLLYGNVIAQARRGRL